MKKGTSLRTAFATYTITGQLGQGGSGTVYSAVDQGGDEVALKVVDTSAASPERLKRFRNELHFGTRHEDPKLMKVFDYGVTDEGHAFYVMPRYHSTLRDLIGEISAAEAFAIGRKLLDAVEAAHLLGATHRDLKPENVMISKDRSAVVLGDFGIARFQKEDLLTTVETQSTTRLANFRYAAPEQKVKGARVDVRADIFALGLMLNELFTGDVPQGTSYRTVGGVAPEFEHLDAVIESMIAQDPAGRLPSVGDVKAEISRRGRDYLARQELSALKARSVKRVGAVEDPLLENELRIVDVDWDDDVLTLTLSEAVNQKWVSALQRMGNHAYLEGSGPDSFRFKGQLAMVNVRADDVQYVIDHFKSWLPRATAVYRSDLERAAKEQEERAQQRLEAERRKAQERADVLDRLKF